MNRTTSVTLAALLALVAVAVILLLISGPIGAPLKGDKRHDLGVIPLTLDGKGFAEHTFTLTNISADPVRIVTSKVSCGCTTTNDLDDKVVPPGESIDIVAVMSLNSSIEKHVRLTLLLGKYGELILNLSGKGRRADPLYVRRSPIELMDGKTQLNLYYEADSNTPPAQPGIEAPAGFVITVGNWETERRVDNAHGRPAVYAAPMSIEQVDDAVDNAIITITLDDHVAKIPIG